MQLEGMDEPLRNGLWSVFYETIAQPGRQHGTSFIDPYSQYYDLLITLWRKFYKLSIDTFFSHKKYGSHTESIEFLRVEFYKMSWFETYDFLEFVAQSIPEGSTTKVRFIENCNEILKQEVAGYRFIGSEITQITADEEVAEIEQAINEANANPVSSHLKRALELLSDRTEPDYRNSIKESISAVEALCVNLTGATTLGQALTKLDKDSTIKTHPALNEAFKKLYGYTSDAGGIRHALLEEDSLEFEDAKFMLVSCSAFVNYLQAKAAKAS